MADGNRRYHTCGNAVHGISEDRNFLGNETVIVAERFAILRQETGGALQPGEVPVDRTLRQMFVHTIQII
jgi:hypothetical protein